MKKLGKILKWVFLIILVLIVSVSAIVMARQNLTYVAIYPDIKASTDSAVIARGRHLVYSSAHCIDCHNKKNSDSLIQLGLEVPLTGGVLFDLPVGKIYSKNITPDEETGIGKFTDAEIARSLRYGVHPDGKAVFDFMPFHNMSDEDLTAVISYLRVQQPVSNTVPKHDLNTLGRVVNAFLIKPVGPDGEVPKKVIPDTTAVYGRYLAISVAECSGCHTKRDMAGKFVGPPFAGGNYIDKFLTPNLTTDTSGRMTSWPKELFIKRFRMGKLIPGSPMPWNSYKRMTDDELTAVYNYLKTVPAAKMPEEKK